MRKLFLENLINGKVTGLSKNVSSFLFEAVTVALYLNNHHSGTLLKIEGDYQETVQLFWNSQPSESILNNWNDKKETVEYASTAIAFLLLEALTDYCFFARATQDDEADFLLNKKGNSTNFQEMNPCAYLEVSGIWKETSNNTMNMRFNLKKRKIEKNG